MIFNQIIQWLKFEVPKLTYVLRNDSFVIHQKEEYFLKHSFAIIDTW